MRQRYRWLPARTWLALILFWLTSMIGATVVQTIPNVETSLSPIAIVESWTILVMLIMVGVCVFNPRQPWPIWKKLLVFPIAMFAQAILHLLGLLPTLVAHWAGALNSRERIERMFALTGALPVVIYVMRQSRLFVTAKAEPPPAATQV